MQLDKRKVSMAMAEAVITSAELSTKAGIHISTLIRALNGTQVPTPVTVGKIAKALNVSVESIIKKEE